MQHRSTRWICFLLLLLPGLIAAAPSATQPAIAVSEDTQQITVETDALRALIRKKGYVSGIAAGSFVDKKTGAKDVGFGLHVMDFLLAPGWAADAYERDPKLHGNLPKHFIEGPQLCTHAKELHPTILRGSNFVAVQMRYTYTEAAPGLKPGSTWEQTLLFQPGLRYILTSEKITSVNDVDDLFYRLDMPGHIRHHGADSFVQVYLSYLPDMIPASEFDHDFAPDEKFLYQRNPDKIPPRIIRAYQTKLEGKPGPWLAGMTLDPSEVCEAWCHQRGYVCLIEELHRHHVKAGETFGNAYAVGWFDDVAEMEKVYDTQRNVKGLSIEGNEFRLVK